MDPTPAPATSYLVLKVAAGVVVGGLVLLGLAKYCGIVVVVGSIPSPGNEAPPYSRAEAMLHLESAHRAATSPANAEHASSPAAGAPGAVALKEAAPQSAKPKEVKPKEAEPETTAPATVVPQQSSDQATTDATQQPPASTAASKPQSKPQPRLEAVPDGFRCIDGRLFRVLPNGFEQVTDGSETRYCIPSANQ